MKQDNNVIIHETISIVEFETNNGNTWVQILKMLLIFHVK
jgi:hypothetical protein